MEHDALGSDQRHQPAVLPEHDRSADDARPARTSAMLEVPDNGVMIDYVSIAEMNAIFDANWDGAPFAAPKTLMMGFHPVDELLGEPSISASTSSSSTPTCTSRVGISVRSSTSLLNDVTAAFPAQ